MWHDLKQYSQQWRSVALTTFAVSGAVIGLRLLGAFQLLEWAALDQFFRWRPPEESDSRIVLVTIGESDIATLGQWPVSDAALAQALKRIRQQQPRVVALDIYRDLPVEPGHQSLVDVFQSFPNLIGIRKAIGGIHGAAIAPPPVLAELQQVSASDLVVDDDGTVRRMLLSIRETDGQVVLGLATRVALMYLEQDGIIPEAIHPERQHVRLGKAAFHPMSTLMGGYVWADVGGYQVMANFRHVHQGFTEVSLADVLQGRVPPNLMRDRIVLIGAKAASLGDRLRTPFSHRSGDLPGTPGVVIHADFISQLLSAALEGRPLLRSWAEPWEWLWIIVWSAGGAVLGWTLRSPQRTTVGTIGLAGGLTGLAYLLFLQGWWIPLVPAVVALVGAALWSESYILWDKLLLSKRQLEEYAQTLEQKVIERTHQLSEKNQQLESEIWERQQTERALHQAKEAAEAASRTKSRFLATMSHELRTPLNSILGFAQLLLHDEEYVKSDLQEAITIIHESGEHLLALIDDVLTMAKLEAGRTTLNPNCVDLQHLLGSLMQLLRLRAETKGLSLRMESMTPLPPRIVTDEGKLRQILINLLGNAIKFTDQGTVVLRVRFEVLKGVTPPALPDASLIAAILVLEVEDTGPGIAQDELEMLFQPFEQTETGRRSQQGTGLGLAISREFAHLMGGDITVASQVGQGSVFSVHVPVALPLEQSSCNDCPAPGDPLNSPTISRC